jgi:hypothetical protein
MYMILDATSGAALPGVSLFDSPQAANAAAKQIAKATGLKTRIKPVVKDEWRKREDGRLKDGTYKLLPAWWTDAVWWVGSMPSKDHYAHLSSDGTRIAFTETPEKGAADRQLTMSPSAYLGRFFSNVLGGYEISTISTKLLYGDVEVNYSRAPEDFERVYENQNVFHSHSSNESCMRYERDYFQSKSSGHHPAYVFGAGDLAIAWIEDKSSSDFKIKARAVVYPDKMTYVRTYAVSEEMNMVLTNALEAAGYKKDRGFAGARLLKIECRGGLVMPYIDGDHYMYVKNDFVHLTDEDGFEYEPHDTEGVSYLENDGYAPRVDCHFTGAEIIESNAIGVMMEGGRMEFCDVDRVEEFAVECPLSNRWIEKGLAQDTVTAVRRRTRLGDQTVEVASCLKDIGLIFFCDLTQKWYYAYNFSYINVRTGKDEDGMWIHQIWERDSAVKEDLVQEIHWDTYSKTYLATLTEKQRIALDPRLSRAYF